MPNKTFPLRMPADLHHQVRIAAAVDNISMREFVQRIVQGEINRRARGRKADAKQ